MHAPALHHCKDLFIPVQLAFRLDVLSATNWQWLIRQFTVRFERMARFLDCALRMSLKREATMRASSFPESPASVLVAA
jgi:hypothetical protein